MKYIITESKLLNVFEKYIEMEFPGFSDISYSWANYNCGMGECCDPYAVGFVLPENHYDDYLFKLVDSRYYDNDGDYPDELSDDLPEPCYEQPNIHDPVFDTIVISEDMYERIENMFGKHENWGYDFLKFLNNRFDIHAKELLTWFY